MNENNLIPIRTESEAREKGRKGGRKSGETRRRKASMKATMKELLALPVSDTKTWNQCAAMGIDPEKIDNQTAMLVALFQRAILSGDVSAVKEILSIIGEDNEAELLKLKKQELKLKEKRLEPPEDETPDDGFLEALNGSAAEDWNNEDED